MKRYFPYVAVLVALFGLNLLRWRTPEALGHARGSGHEPLLVSDYRVKVMSASVSADEKPRDLFYSEIAAPVAHPVVARARPLTPPEPPPKTPQELQEEAARAQLATIKVTGIAFRGGKGQAYLTAGEESYLVKAGDRIADRFDVLEITSEYVSLKDPATSVGAKVPLQGEPDGNTKTPGDTQTPH
jgi:hypothetical protein